MYNCIYRVTPRGFTWKTLKDWKTLQNWVTPRGFSWKHYKTGWPPEGSTGKCYKKFVFCKFSATSWIWSLKITRFFSFLTTYYIRLLKNQCKLPWKCSVGSLKSFMSPSVQLKYAIRNLFFANFLQIFAFHPLKSCNFFSFIATY